MYTFHRYLFDHSFYLMRVMKPYGTAVFNMRPVYLIRVMKTLEPCI